MGKKDGMCEGIGGSQHICDRNFFSNGILGFTLPFATEVEHIQLNQIKID